MSIEHLKGLDLHDCPVHSIDFDFTEMTIKIKVDIFNESKDDYDFLELYFYGVSRISMDMSELNPIDIEISSYEVSETENNRHIQFILLEGPGQPDIKLSFEFDRATKTFIDVDVKAKE